MGPLAYATDYVPRTSRCWPPGRTRPTWAAPNRCPPAVGATLRFLACAVGARTAVEIGTGCGSSGIWLLRGMRPGSTLTSVDIEPEYQRMARKAFTQAGFAQNQCRLILGRALDVLPRLSDGTYDMVFCDADVRDYPDYLIAALRLLRPGGVVAFNNAAADGSAPGTTPTTATHNRPRLDQVRGDDDGSCRCWCRWAMACSPRSRGETRPGHPTTDFKASPSLAASSAVSSTTRRPPPSSGTRMTMPRPSLVTSSGPSPVRGFIAAILPSPSSPIHARRRSEALRCLCPAPRVCARQSRVPAAEPASHNRFYLSPYYPVFGSRMVMIGHARCRPGARSGLFAGRSAIAPACRVIRSAERAPAARDGPGGRARAPARAREEAKVEEAPAAGRAVRRVLIDLTPLRRSRDLRLLVLGELVSVLGTQLTTVAVPYQVYQLTHSSLDVGLVSLAQLFPLIGGALLGGSVVDAMDRRRLLMVAQVLMGRWQRRPRGQHRGHPGRLSGLQIAVVTGGPRIGDVESGAVAAAFGDTVCGWCLAAWRVSLARWCWPGCRPGFRQQRTRRTRPRGRRRTRRPDRKARYSLPGVVETPPQQCSRLTLSTLGGGGNRTRVLQCITRASPGAACCAFLSPGDHASKAPTGSAAVRCPTWPRDRVRR